MTRRSSVRDMQRLIGIGLMVTAQFALASAGAADFERTDAVIDKANRLYSELAFEQALQSLHEAVAIPGNSRSQLLQIYHLQGLCYASLENYPAARQAFARLLMLEPQFQLASNVSPRVRQPFDEVLQTNPQRVEVRLHPPTRAVAGEPLVFTASVGPDPQRMATVLRIHHRRGARGTFRSAQVDLHGKGEYRLSIAADDWQGAAPESVAWYASVDTEHAAHLQVYGDAARPVSIPVVAPTAAAVASPAPEAVPWLPWAVAGGSALVVTAAVVTAAVLISQSPADQKVDFGIDVSTRQ